MLLQVLAREPLKVVNSFSEVLDTTLEETSYPALCRIVSELRALGCCPHPIRTPATVCSYPVLGAVVARFRPCFSDEHPLRQVVRSPSVELPPRMLLVHTTLLHCA